MARQLPRFEPVGVDERRALWVKYRGNQDVQRLLLELAQVRRAIEEIEAYFSAVQKVWAEENLGQLVAMEKIRLLLVEQGLRQSALAGLKAAPAATNRTSLNLRCATRSRCLERLYVLKDVAIAVDERFRWTALVALDS